MWARRPDYWVLTVRVDQPLVLWVTCLYKLGIGKRKRALGKRY